MARTLQSGVGNKLSLCEWLDFLDVFLFVEGLNEAIELRVSCGSLEHYAVAY